MNTRLLLVGVAAVSGLLIGLGCLGDPELKTCAEFPLGTEGCGEPCDVYCDAVIETCPQTFPGGRGECITDCSAEPVNPTIADGVFGEEENNTFSCRLTYLRRGQCENVGLVDSPTCTGASCAEYCSLMLTNCPGAYPDASVCQQNCDLLPRGEPGIDANTVECRFGYAEAAADDQGGPACDAASLNGGGVCGDEPCDPYCDLVLRNCTGSNEIYPDRAECLRVCRFMDGAGRFNDWDFEIQADSVQCRSWHAGPPAEAVPSTHCPHTRVYNIEQCGIDPDVPQQPDDWPCLTFCDIVARECPGTFGSAAGCRTVCAGLPELQDFDPAVGPLIFPVTTSQCPTF